MQSIYCKRKFRAHLSPGGTTIALQPVHYGHARAVQRAAVAGVDVLIPMANNGYGISKERNIIQGVWSAKLIRRSALLQRISGTYIARPTRQIMASLGVMRCTYTSSAQGIHSSPEAMPSASR